MTEPQIVETQKCPICKRNVPPAQFRSDAGGKITICKSCDRHSKAMVRQHINDVVKQADELQMQVLSEMATEDDEIPDEIPDLGTFVSTMVRAFGGMRGLAIQNAATFLKATPGGAIRQRMLADLGKHVAKASELGYAKTPLEMMSDEELEQIIEERAKRTLRLVDGSEEEEIAEAG